MYSATAAGSRPAAWIAGVQAAAKIGGRDVVVDSGEEVDAGTLGGGESERGEFGFGERVFRAAWTTIHSARSSRRL